MKKCPRCGGEARRSHHHGFLQRNILRLLGIRPFRCRDCGNRFHRFSLNGNDAHHQEHTSSSSVFGEGQNRNGHFTVFIAEIRKKERELGLVKQEHGLADELRQIHKRAEQQGLTAESPQRHGEPTDR